MKARLNIQESDRQNSDNETIPGFWKDYQRYSEHVALLDGFVTANPELIQKIEFGKSYENRTMVLAKIGLDSEQVDNYLCKRLI